MMLRQVKPRNARSKRALEKKEPQLKENPKTTLFLRGEKCSQIVQLALTDLNSLKRPLAIRFTKKNSIHPFEDSSSLEFFSQKNDASLILFGLHSKKRPHCLTFARCFDHKILDMLELYIDPDTFRTLDQFKNAKCAVGLKPLLVFSGIPFESPTSNAHTLAKSLFLDLFKGYDTSSIDVEGLQYMIHISAQEEVDDGSLPKIHLRVYRLKTKKGGHKLPRVEVEEMGPRIDFRIGRLKQPDESMMKDAMKRPKSLEAKKTKNIETDIVGDKMGRIHLGKQDLSQLQARKMKGLKRNHDEVTGEEDAPQTGDDNEAKRIR